jgi:hypothetical protein
MNNKRRGWFFIILPFGLIVWAFSALAGHHSTAAAPLPDTSTSAPAAAPATSAPAQDSITLQVTGPATTVTAGEGASSLTEASPLNLTVPARYHSYTLTVITGPDGGTAVAKILVNGKVVGQGEASGPNQFSVVDISDISGTWTQYG